MSVASDSNATTRPKRLSCEITAWRDAPLGCMSRAVRETSTVRAYGGNAPALGASMPAASAANTGARTMLQNLVIGCGDAQSGRLHSVRGARWTDVSETGLLRDDRDLL